jgi:alpha-mannosidase
MLFITPHMAVEINRKTGLIDRWTANGKTYLGKDSCVIDVMQDRHDAWGMTFREWRDKIGSFTLLSDEEGTAFSDQDATIPSIRVIEDGDVRTVVEAVYGYEGSRARVHYKLSKQAPVIDVDIRIVNQEKRKMFKLGLTPADPNAAPALEVAFGEEPMKTDGVENVGHKYITVLSPDGGRLNILNRGIYGSSWDKGTLYLTLLHSPGHTTHPLGDRRTLPTDRHADYMEQGERDFSIRLVAGDMTDTNTARDALTFNETPMAVNVFPSGDGYDEGGIPAGRVPFLTLSQDSPVILTALKKTEDGQDVLARLFNPTATEAPVTVKCPALDLCESLTLTAYEAATYRVRNGGLIPCRMDEKL